MLLTPILLAQGIPDSVLTGAANGANAIAGTNVRIKTAPGGDPNKVLVTTNGATQGRIAATAVEPGGAYAYGISIDLSRLKAMFPSIMDDPELLQLVLTYILSHEFDHVPGGSGGQGGNGHTGGSSCVHLSDYVDDCARLCADVAAILADPNMDAAKKCKRVGALCKLYEHTRGAANSPANVAAAANCSNVTVTNGEIIGPCANCPSGECPVHGTDFGGR